MSHPSGKSFGDSLGELLESLEIWLALHKSTDFVKIQTYCQELLSLAGPILDGCNCYSKHYLFFYSRLTNKKIIQNVLDDELCFLNGYQDITKDKDLKTAFTCWPETEAYLTWNWNKKAPPALILICLIFLRFLATQPSKTKPMVHCLWMSCKIACFISFTKINYLRTFFVIATR